MSDYEQEQAGLDDDTASVEDEDLLAAQEEKEDGDDGGALPAALPGVRGDRSDRRGRRRPRRRPLGRRRGRGRARAVDRRARASSTEEKPELARIVLVVVKVDETTSLWQEYKRSRDPGVRDRLILTYAPLVKYVAGRVGSGLPAHVDEGDLVQYGLLGLISAIERFDLDRDIKFETYAIARITGAIIDELRAMDWVPRSVRARAREIERAIAELEKKLMRAPSDQEIADKVGITEEELGDSLTEISRSSIAALDELWTVSSSGGDQIALIDTIEDTQGPDPQALLSETEMKEAIADAIARLPEREKLVVTLYYYEELTLREIGEVLGVTESRVSQLHTKAILRLKARLAGSPARATLER
jgi:RNA polymerase sigma factor for flagellar operon FliA